MKEKIPRYLYPKEDELPIPHYFSVELGVESKKSRKGGTRSKKRSKRRKNRLSKFRSKIQRHTKRVR
jgi:hypothetical protein